MKNLHRFLILFVLTALVLGCEKDDNNVPENIEVQNFVWKGLNLYYLWQADVPNLSDFRFADQQDLNRFLYGNPDPDALFENLLYKPSSQFGAGEAVDRFSVIFSDYTQLEGILAGTTKNTGADIALYYKDDTHYQIVGVVRYILPNSDAAAKDIQRGDLFYGINDQQLTVDNYAQLLSLDSYTLNFADYDGGDFTPNGQSVQLNKTVVSENPVYRAQVISSGGHQVGYLMYNGFYPNYESALNQAFAQFKSQGVSELVLDLRYNGGGSIATASRLASLITGQFNGQVFAKEQWNAKVEAYYEDHEPATLYNLFTNKTDDNETLNSLGLSRVFVLTTRATASASELVINGLKPYVDVVQIGTETIGKNVGSITLYDSPSFSKAGANPNHHWAMQPLVLKIVNRDGFGDYTDGIFPDTSNRLPEDLENLGTLGDPSEPLLALALDRINGGGRSIAQPHKVLPAVRDKRAAVKLRNTMYTSHLPANFQ